MNGDFLKTGFARIAQNRRLSFALLCAVIVVVCGNMFFNDFIMDDFDFIVNWPLIQDIRNLPRFFWGYIPPEGQGGIYSPLRTLFFALNYMVWGPNPFGFHLLALATHVLGTWAVYLIAARLLRSSSAALLTALLFAAHPLHMESVVAMTGSIDTIGVVFSLFAFYYYIQAVGDDGRLALSGGRSPVEETPAGGRWGLRNRRAYAGALLLALLAVFTHELTVALPLVFLFYDVFFRGPRLPWAVLARRNAPFFGMVAVYVALKGAVLGGISRGYYLMGDFRAHMLVMIKAWFKYVWLTLFPVVSTHDHVISPGILSFNEKDFDRQAVLSQSFLDPQVLYAAAGLAAVVLLGVWAFRRKPVVAFGIGWFFLCLAPVSGLISSSVYFAERYLYAASMGFCLVVVYYLHRFVHAAPAGLKSRRIITAAVFVAGVMGFYGIRMFVRSGDLRNQLVFYESSVRLAPQSAYLLNDLGIIYTWADRYPEAVKSFEEAIRRKPQEAHFYFSAERAYSMMERFPEAVACLEKAVAINPEFAEAHYNLAGLLMHLNREKEALDHLGQALTLYRRQGRIYEAGEAKEMFEEYLYRKKHPKAARQRLEKILGE